MGRRFEGLNGSRLPLATRAAGAAGLLALTACVTPTTELPPDPGVSGHASRSVGSVPSWAGDELSWEKLNAIEYWLSGEGAGRAGFWHAEGRLQLAEGQLQFAGHDVDGGIASDYVRERLLNAHVGFERVLRSPELADAQRERAERGRERCRAMLGGAGRPQAVAGIIARGSWGASTAIPAKMDRNRRQWRHVTIHHSAMPDPPRLSGGLNDYAAHVRKIQRAHMRGEGFGDIGYHFLIDPAGRIFQGRSLDWQGAHSGGSNNRQNIGICVIGNFDIERPTKPALQALEALVNKLRISYDIPRSNVVGHCKWKGTQCPGTHLLTWVKAYE